MVWLFQNCRSNKCLIPQTLRASGGLGPPWPPNRALPWTLWGSNAVPRPLAYSRPHQPQILEPPLVASSTHCMCEIRTHNVSGDRH